jgi:hypothetical protein
MRMRAIYEMGIRGKTDALPDLTVVADGDPSAEIRALAQMAIAHINATQGRSMSDDARADLEWTKQFLKFLETSSIQFRPDDVEDLTGRVSENALSYLKTHTAEKFNAARDTGLGHIADASGEVVAGQPVSHQESGQRVETVGTYQMFWDCPFCGAQKLLGVTHRHCPNCGASQDPDYRYFPEPGEEVALHNHRYVGVDLICPACEGLNSAAANFCGTCGADLSEAKQASIRETQHEATGYHADKGDPIKERFQADMQTATSLAPVLWFGFPRNRVIIGAIAMFLVLVIGGGAFLLFYKQEETVIVTEHRWERVIVIEEFGPQAGSADCVAMPNDAYSVTRRTETRTRQVPDGQTCREECSNQRVDNGDGSFRTERVCRDVCETKYRTESYQVEVCSFTVDRWQHDRDEESHGVGLDPEWPAYTLAAAGNNRGHGEERVGERQESYILKLRRTDGDMAECKFNDIRDWDKYVDGQELTIKFNLLGDPDCDSIETVGGE